jgi:tripartite-type tricarboxylate transporter receptor subunit TctC
MKTGEPMLRTMYRASLTLLCLAGLVLFGPVRAQDQYPGRLVKIVVPYPPGANTDIVTRLYAKSLSEMLGQPFIVDNKPGAGTNIGAESVARSPADGYTLFVAQLASHGINSSLFKNLTYDPVKDFASVGFMARSPMFLFVTPSLPVHSVRELIDYARANPGKLSFASAGNGSPQHLAGVLLAQRAKIDVVHVPYKGAAAALTDLISGQVQFMFDSSAMNFVRQGRLRVLGVADTKRWPTEPEVPTLAESGLADVIVSGYFGLSAPARTPEATLQRLNEAMNAIAGREDTARQLATMGLVPMKGTRAEMSEFIAREIEKWSPVVKASGARID